MRKAVAELKEEQKADTLLFLNNNIEELAVLPAGQGSLAVELVKQLLDEMPIVRILKNETNQSILNFNEHEILMRYGCQSRTQTDGCVAEYMTLVLGKRKESA